jgi:hypothetical protein
MKAVIRSVIALTALIAFASPAKAQGCEGEGKYLLCGFVWLDTDGDGIQDESETAIDGVKVTLFAWDETTDTWDPVSYWSTGSGLYFFSVADDGLYKIVAEAPTGSVPSPEGQGSDEALDSDGVNDAGGSATQFTLGAGGVTSLDSDFGFVPTGRVSPGTGTPGYWKNHTDVWTGVTIGGVYYSSEEASAIMGRVAKDKTFSLFAALVAAKLNVAIGNESSCIDARIEEADGWLTIHPVGSNVAASSPAWQQIAQAHKELDDYNNGRLCAPHRN